MSSTPVSTIEKAYRDRIDSMTVAERVARSSAMFAWTREQLARQIASEGGLVDDESVKWLVALRIYENEPQVRKWILQKLDDVSN